MPLVTMAPMCAWGWGTRLFKALQYPVRRDFGRARAVVGLPA
ncbi:MAG: hypothetical protein WCK74_03330 [Gemmatimonadaceae bacterium]|jgi:hypothetical protein